MYDLVIIGAGPAGLTAGLYAGRKRLKTLLISLDIGGQGNLAINLENYPGFPKTSGIKLMEKFKNQVKKNSVEFYFGKVVKVDKVEKEKIFKITLSDQKEFWGKAVILCLGRVPSTLGLPNEEKYFGKGIHTCVTCDAPLYQNKEVVIIGGGNSALDGALLLSRFAKKVYLIHRRDEFRGDPLLVERVKSVKNIEILLEAIPLEIRGEKLVKSLLIEKGKEKREIFLDGIFLAIGHSVDPSLVKGLVKLNEKNEIIIDANNQTSCPGIFAAGDCTNIAYKQIVISAGEGAKAALSAYQYLTGRGMIDWH